MKYIKMELDHKWNMSHFSNGKIMADIKNIVCVTPGFICKDPCDDCPKNINGNKSRGKIKIFIENKKIKVQILLHAPDDRIEQTYELVRELIKLLRENEKVELVRSSFCQEPLF